MAGIGSLTADTLLWRIPYLAFEVGAGKDGWQIELSRNPDGSHRLKISRNGERVVDEASVSGGKGEIDGTQVMQFGIDDHPLVKSLVVYLKEDGRLSCKLEVVVQLEGAPRTVE